MDDERPNANHDSVPRVPTKPSTAPESAPKGRSNQHEQRTHEQHQQQPLAAFFAGKSVHRARRLSISAAHAAQMHALAASGGTASSSASVHPTKPVAVTKRKLQIESLSPPTLYMYPRAPVATVLVSPRGRHNARTVRRSVRLSGKRVNYTGASSCLDSSRGVLDLSAPL